MPMFASDMLRTYVALGAYRCLIASTPTRLRQAKRRSSISTGISGSSVRVDL
jgi:hypothetical protein